MVTIKARGTILVMMAFALSTYAYAASKEAPLAKYYDEELGRWYTIPRIPNSVIRSQDLRDSYKKGASISTSSRVPKEWPIRALYHGPSGELLEFDRNGKIKYDSRYPTGDTTNEIYVMRQVFAKGNPLWVNAEVFNMVSESEEKSPGYAFAFAPIGIVRGTHDSFCPVRDVNPIAHRHSSHAPSTYELDGTCDRAISVKINGHNFLTYPGFKDIKDPYFFWSAQYFSDPVTPIYTESGDCLRYCDEESQKMEEALRKSANSL